MGDTMYFPDTWEEFVDDYSFKDRKEEYTNGSMLIPVFRVKQMIEHYFEKETQALKWFEFHADKFDRVNVISPEDLKKALDRAAKPILEVSLVSDGGYPIDKKEQNNETQKEN